MSLNGLPDVGDPFDVAAFRAFRVPDDQNAFAFLRRAEEKLTPSPAQSRALLVSGGSRVAAMGPGESPGDRTVSTGGRPIRRREPGRRSRREYRTHGPVGSVGGRQATSEWRHGGRLGLLSRDPPDGNSPQAAGKPASARRPLRVLGTFVARTARDLGGRSEDIHPPASGCPARSTQERAEAGMGFICDESRISRNDALARAAGPFLRSAGCRLGISLSTGRHGLVVRHGRASRGRASFPLARARAQPARPATPLCQLAGDRRTRGASETGRLCYVLSAEINEPDELGHDQRDTLRRRSIGTGWRPRATPEA